ncbi:BapA/Bap/LapF family prefix-like domain-containing protein [Neorhizobium sp. NPDC001467]|uniref:BapA/Bap/LapF family prefix-like domain-containing protein n=1 Tax=Neorhizobium sp. NPDC001467 TaxID=3390595 RepID=UPI003CFEF980
MVAVVVDKVSGQTSTVAGSDIPLSGPSTVRLTLAPTDVASTARSGSDLIINLKSGEQIRIDGFFEQQGEQQSELVFQDEAGNVWSTQYAEELAGVQVEELGAVDQMVGSAAAGGASGLGVLAPLGLLGAVAAAAAGMGGGGGGGDDGGNGGGDGGEPGTPAPGAPTVRLGNGDAFLNAQETAGGSVTVTVSLAGTGAVAGDRLTVNGTVTTLTEAQIAAGVVEISLPAPTDGQTLTVTATLTDAAGNTSSVTTVSAVVDTTPPGSPAVVLGNGDTVISAEEVVNGQVPVRVNLAGSGAVAGDTLTVNGTPVVLTAAQIAAGTVEIPVPVPADGQPLTVSVSLTDAAGNASPPTTITVGVDTTAPSAPVVTLGNGDNVITGSEVVNGEATVRIDLAGTGAVAGDTVSVNGTPIVLTAAQIAAGFITAPVTVPATGLPLDVSVSITDAAGNSSTPVTVTALVTTDPSSAPVVSIGDGDAYINATEAAGGTVAVSVDLANTGAIPGDTLTVNGNTITLTATDIAAGRVTTSLPVPAEGESLTVTVSYTDAGGNVSPSTVVSALVDTTPPTVGGLTLGDGVGAIGSAEITGGSVAASVSLAGSGAAAGDVLTVNGVSVTLTEAQILAGTATVPVTVPGNGQTLFVTATLTDAAGNTSPIATASATVDTTAPGGPTITLGNGDTVLGPSDIVGGSTSVVVGLAGTGAAAGDRLTINGNTITLTAADIGAGQVTTTLAVPAEGATLTVTASLTDAGGNTSPVTSVSAVVDTTPPFAPGLVLGNGDNVILASELVNGAVPVTVNLGGTNAAAGDTLLVNGVSLTLTADQIAAGFVETNVPALPDGAQLVVTATLIDLAGNSSGIASASALMDTDLLGTPGVSLGDGDAYINAGEVINGAVTVTVTLAGTGAVAGDTLRVNGVDIPLTAADITNGVVTTQVPAAADGTALNVTTTVIGAAGTASQPITVSATVDTTLPIAPTLVIGNNDAFITAGEISNGTINVRVNLAGTGAAPGDTLTVNGVDIVLTDAQIGAGFAEVAVQAPTTGQTFSVSALLTDIAGNSSASAGYSALVDTVNPGQPYLTIGNGDGFIGLGEIVNGQVEVVVNIDGADAEVNDTLTVNGTTIAITPQMIADGLVRVPITAPADGEPLSVQAVLTDAAGNQSPLATFNAVVDTQPPGIPAVTLGDGNAFINAQEAAGGLVAVRIGLAGTNAVPGDLLTVNGTTTVLTAQQVAAGVVVTSTAAPATGETLTVNATLTDSAGNISLVGTASALVDTSTLGTPVVTVGDGNGIIIASEVTAGQVGVTVNIAGTGAVAGDSLIINGQTIVLSQAQIDANLVATSLAVPSDGSPLTVQATLNDTAGNVSAPAIVTTPVDISVPTAPTIILGDGNGFIIGTEVVGGRVSVTVDISTTGAVAGDVLFINGAPLVLAQAQIDAGAVTTTVPAAADGQTLTVTAQLSDAAGNLSPLASIGAFTDTIAPTLPGLTLGDGNGVINLLDVTNNAVTLRVDIAATGAVAGDTLTVNGVEIPILATDVSNGFITTTLGIPAGGQPLSVTAFLTDVAGNISPAAIVTAPVDIVAPLAPAITITGATNNLLGIDDIVGGRAAVSVSLANTGAQAGDILTVNGQAIVLDGQMITNTFVNTTVAAPADGETLTVTALLTDAAGNPSGSTSVFADIDLTAPGRPIVTLGDGDGFINGSEVTAGTTGIRVSLVGTGANVGDTLNISGLTPITLSQLDIDNGFVTATVPVGPEGQPFTVNVSLIDPANNSSPVATVQATVDTVAPLQPGVTIGDGGPAIIFTELVNGEVPVTINLLGRNAVAGDILTVNGTTIVLDQTQIDANQVALTLPAPGDGVQFVVNATITDAAGNVSSIGSATALIDTGILGVPTLTLGDGDGFLNAGEVVNGQVTVRVGLAGTGALAGDTLTVGVDTFVLTQGDIDNGFVTTVAAPADGVPLTLGASFQDVNGNASPVATATAVVDTTIPGSPIALIGDGNALIGNAEISGGLVAVRIDLSPTSAVAGDTLTVNGTATVLTQADIDAGFVQTSVLAPANGQILTVNAQITDAAGNASIVTPVTALVDTLAPGLPVITIGNGDGFILPAEITAGNVSVSVGLAGTGAVAGDFVTVNGVTTTLTAGNISSGVVNLDIAAPAEGQALTINAALTDAAGNVSPIATASAVVDTIVPTAPGVTLGNGDAYINAAEIVSGRVGVSIDISGRGIAAGDRLTVNGTTTVVTAEQAAAGTVATTVAAPANGQSLTVTATVTDTSGNVSLPGTVTAVVDTTVPTAPVLSVGNGDALIGSAEIANGLITVGVNLAGTGAVAGDSLTVNGVTTILTAPQVQSGVVSTTVAAPANGQPLAITASLTDVAGNTSPTATFNAVVDTSPPTAPGVTLGNGDGYINASEVTAGTVAVSISLAGTGAVAGDRLIVNGTTTILTAAQVAAGVLATTVIAPASGATLNVGAALLDAAGNTSPVTTVSALVDTTPPVVPTVAFLNDTGTPGDGISTDGTIRVTGIEPGARWEYSTNGGATWALGTGPGFTLPAGAYNVLVRQTDVAGNTSTRTVGPLTVINLAAVNDDATLALNINPSVVTQPRQSGAVAGVLNLGLLGNAVDVALLTNQSPLRFTVADNTTQQVSVRGGGAALASLALVGEQNYDLLVYRVEDGQTQAQLAYELRDWLVFNPGVLGLLLPSWSSSTVALPQFQGGGTYYVVLANPGGVLNLSALANLTVETTSNVVTDYRNVTGSLAGNVLIGDTTVAGTVVASVDQVAVAATGLVIHGDHGTLTIARNGAYSYQADPLYTGVDGSEDTFTYTIVSPDGSTSTAVLTITIDYPYGPQALVTASIAEADNDGMFLMSAGVDSDILDLDQLNTDQDPSDLFARHVGNDLPADQPAIEDLMLDQGGQEIDLGGLTEDQAPDHIPAPTPEPLVVDIQTTLVAVDAEELPIDPFPALHHHDDLVSAPVV